MSLAGLQVLSVLTYHRSEPLTFTPGSEDSNSNNEEEEEADLEEEEDDHHYHDHSGDEHGDDSDGYPEEVESRRLDDYAVSGKELF